MSAAVSHSARVATHQIHANLDGEGVKTVSIRVGVVNIAYQRSQFGEMRDARQSAAVSHTTWVATHQTHNNLDGDRVKTGRLWGENI